MKREKLTEFFNNYSQNVDNADSLWFRKLSDSVIEHIIQQHINRLYTWEVMTILDAWCGTGRRIKKIMTNNPQKELKFIAYDLFESMLNKAKENLKWYSNVIFIQWDIQDIKDIQSDSIDLCISIYSPISFVDNSGLAIKEIGKTLKKDGEALIMWHSLHNAIDSKINNYLADEQELTELYTKKIVRWNDMLPPLNVYAIEDFMQLWKDNGVQCVWGYGITIYAKPQNEDRDPKNVQKSKISLKLENDTSFFDKVFQLEIKNNDKKELINRWLNILAYFKK
jgi:SAM-dependent methyltransferase